MPNNINQNSVTGVSYNTPNLNPTGPFTDDAMRELNIARGISGLVRYGKTSWIYEEFLHELQGRKGSQKWREMRDNDATVGAIMFALEMLIRQNEWEIEVAGETKQDLEAKEFVESCFTDMDSSWQDTITEVVTMLTYGHCVMEQLLRQRLPKEGSKYNDGKWGWSSWAMRAQETLWRWNFAEDGRANGVEQYAPPDFRLREIPLKKCLHFRINANKNNPEGRSLLRNAYLAWNYKKAVEKAQMIGIERDLAGLPQINIPSSVLAGETPEMAAALAEYEKMLENIRVDEKAGIMMPSDKDQNGNPLYEFKLVGSGSTRKQFDTVKIIQMLKEDIAQSVLADFILLGNNGRGGSYALSVDKTEIFMKAVNSILEAIENIINSQGIKYLFQINNFSNLTDLPQFKFKKLQKTNIKELGTYVKDLATVGMLTADQELEEELRNVSGLPVSQNHEESPTVPLVSNTNEMEQTKNKTAGGE